MALHKKYLRIGILASLELIHLFSNTNLTQVSLIAKDIRRMKAHNCIYHGVDVFFEHCCY